MRRARKVVSLILAAFVALGGLGGRDISRARADAPPAAASLVPPVEVVPSEPAAEIAPPPLEPLPAPTVSYQRRYNMAILGAGLLVATWGADRLLTRDFNAPYAVPPWIPIIGPWFLLYGQTETAAPNKLTMSLLVFDGLLQAGGLTVGILGFVLHKKRMTVSLPPQPRAIP